MTYGTTFRYSFSFSPEPSRGLRKSEDKFKHSLLEPEFFKPAFDNPEVFEKFLESTSDFNLRFNDVVSVDLDDLVEGGLVVFTDNEGIVKGSDEYWSIYNSIEEILEEDYYSINFALDIPNFTQKVAKVYLNEDERIEDYSYLTTDRRAFHYFFCFSAKRIGLKNTISLLRYILNLSDSLDRNYFMLAPSEYRDIFYQNFDDNIYTLEYASESRIIFENILEFIIKCESEYLDSYPFEWILDAFFPNILDRTWDFKSGFDFKIKIEG